MRRVDVLVIGSGPSGLALTSALASNGVAVANLSLDAHARWPQTYGAWEDELSDLDVPTSHRWSRVFVHPKRERALQRAYVLLDNEALQNQLRERAARDGAAWRAARAVEVRATPQGSVVLDAHGRSHHARLVVNASGHVDFDAAAPSTSRLAFQAAYGVVATFDRPPIKPGSVAWMDYRAEHLRPGEFDAAPTFLYAMHLGGDRYFVEETSLAARPALSTDVLRDRLQRRLAWNGTPPAHVEHVERCLFPMNRSPAPPSRVVAFGGAAGLVHPASGFMVAHALRLTRSVAAEITLALQQEARADDVSKRAWRAVWPSDARRAHRLYTFGLEALLRLRGAELAEFFDAFFDLPSDRWRAFLSRTAAPADVAAIMLQVFTRAPNAVRLSLARSALHEPRTLLGAALKR
ncbi:lycopene cyclase family protein [Deinococcus yavapaiensis]|uniref:Lycopene cyclase (CrtL-type) n=1 Tax=Deinococcus yavapaiensis KR-236 TaxID=694435 RepID=A0A318SA13_9DEIO|nr:lycopene cyclase family protein [Deinococcus yavapaiensis]PYE53074.1 lycopene cyclase (CrtL-type) [Deinococcus yavapaiensis KR-236]